MDGDQGRKPLLSGRGLVLVADFCRATGLDRATVEELVTSATVEGASRLDGEVVGLFDDVLPTLSALRGWGLVVRDDYDPELLRSYVDDSDDPDDELDDAGATWTMGWGDP